MSKTKILTPLDDHEFDENLMWREITQKYVKFSVKLKLAKLINLLHEACVDARKGNLNLKQQIRQIGNKELRPRLAKLALFHVKIVKI